MTRANALRTVGLVAALCTTALGPGAAAQAPGDAARGQRVFAAKHCARCHVPRGQPGVGPALEALRRPQGAYELAGRLWNHAPAMFTVLTQEGIGWPQIGEGEMADLMAYLQADPARDPAPDLSRGQVMLIQKGCLKCHGWKGEGARAAPELSERRGSFAPAARWGATLWSHTPRMAAVAIQRGVLYPRFAGDEMGNLLGFLRGGGAAP
ncbi:MAG: c-type cytochrome [Candidatus Rokubacteria bacterium]|nr:c-type cytochrome [Candidatus Rokubacteria bacterium]